MMERVYPLASTHVADPRSEAVPPPLQRLRARCVHNVCSVECADRESVIPLDTV
jgi:hypothetical protein